MSPVLAIFDDFFTDPQAVFREISSGPFEPYQSAWDGVTYPGINLHVPREIQDFVLKRLEGVTGKKIRGVCFARTMLKGMKAPHRIHSDVIMGDYSMHVYLSEDWPEGSGTSFWRHKTEGDRHTSETDVTRVDQDHDNMEMWEREFLLSAQFNRAVIHDSSLFHAAEPHEGFGDSPSNGRLVLTCFFSEEK
jgi:hypothetical protein